MKLLPYIFIPVLLAGCAAPRHTDPAAATIDTTSLITISKSVGAAKPEDRQIVGEIPCDLAHELGLDLNDPGARDSLLKALRVQFRGKTVAEIAAEVRQQHKSQADKLQKFATDYIHERQEKWKRRTEHVSLIALGTKEEQVLKLLGNPDAKSDSNTEKNWFYRFKAARKEDQIWTDAMVFQITDRAVSKIIPITEHQRIIDLRDASQKEIKNMISAQK